MSPEEFASLNANAESYFKSQRKTAPAKKKKGFWTDQISTGGSLGGAAAGAAGGAALGSVVPIAGTALGGLIGAVLGGAAGAVGGQAVENKVSGDNLGKDLLMEGLIGGATSIGPLQALKLAKGVGGIARGAAPGGVAISKAATGDTLKTSLGQRIAESGNKALASQYGTISKPVARSTNPTKTVGELAQMGITKPTDAERIASQITGPDGILNQQVAKAVGGAAPVDTSTLRRVFSDALDNNGIVANDRKSLETLFNAQMVKLSGGARGSLDPKVNPTDALDMMKAFEKRIANLSGKGDNYRLSTPERVDQAGVLRLVKDELEDQLYQGAGANKQVAGLMTPELRERLVSLMPGNKAWVRNVDENIMKAGDIGALRSAQAPFVRMRKIIDEGDMNSMTFGGRTGNMASGQGIKGALLEGAQNMVKNPASRAYAATTRGLSGAGLPSAAGGTSPLGAATRAGVGGSLINALKQQPAAEPEIPELMGDEVLANQEMPVEEQAPSNPFGVTREQVAEQMMLAMQNGDAKGYSQLENLYKLVDDYEKENAQAGGGKKLTSQQATAVSKTATATNALDRLEQLYGGAGGGGRAQGTVAGIMGAVGGNASARAYNDQLASTARFMGRAMGETGAGSDADAAAFIARLPRLTDTPEEARIKLAELRALLEDSRKNLIYYGGGATEEEPAVY
jgi:hypothetical protein